MNRLIEFRCWDINNKTMRDMPVFLKGEKVYILRSGGLFNPDGTVLFETKEFIVTQFTGLFDKNGKKIFEGDIVTNNYFSFTNKPVVYSENGFTLEMGKNSILACNPEEGWWEDCEIIGNVFENPDLLK